MEALKLLVDLVKDLPTMALWVIVGFFIYKISIVGSVYGVIRFVTAKTHDIFVAFANREKYEEINITAKLNDLIISGNADILIYQITRLCGISSTSAKLNYIHSSDVMWLREAIDEKIDRDLKNN